MVKMVEEGSPDDALAVVEMCKTLPAMDTVAAGDRVNSPAMDEHQGHLGLRGSVRKAMTLMWGITPLPWTYLIEFPRDGQAKKKLELPA